MLRGHAVSLRSGGRAAKLSASAADRVRSLSESASIRPATAIAVSPDLRVRLRDVVDRAARQKAAQAAVELVGPVARELQRRLIFEQTEFVAVALPAELAERVDDAGLQRRHVPRRIALVAEAVDVGADIVPEAEAPSMVAVREPARVLRKKMKPARAPVRVRLPPDPLRVLDRRLARSVEAVHLERRDEFVHDLRGKQRVHDRANAILPLLNGLIARIKF